MPGRCHLVAIGLFTSHSAVEYNTNINIAYCKRNINCNNILFNSLKTLNFSFHIKCAFTLFTSFSMQQSGNALQHRLNDSWLPEMNSPQILLLRFFRYCRLFCVFYLCICALACLSVRFSGYDDLLLWHSVSISFGCSCCVCF